MRVTYSTLFTLFALFVSLLAFPFSTKSYLLVDILSAILIVNITIGQIIYNLPLGQNGLDLIG